MSFYQLVKLIMMNIKILLGVSIGLAMMLATLIKDGPRKYSSNTLIYTGLASGYTIESEGSTKVDYFSVNNAFDNLLKVISSRETQTEVGIRLLAQHLMLKEPNPKIISSYYFNELHDKISDELIKSVVDTSSLENTIIKIYSIDNNMVDNDIYHILHDEKSIYSTHQISKISFARVLSSDMIEGSFSFTDPGICQQALIITTEVFKNRFRILKEGETENVIKFFERQTEEVYTRLTAEENRLKAFREANQIINYYEQTKYISSKKEDLDERVSNEKMNLAAALSSLKRIESQLGDRKDLELYNNEIVKFRKQLSEYSEQLTFEELKEEKDLVKIAHLQLEINNLKSKLKNDVEKLYEKTHSVEGLPIVKLLDEWLENVIIIEETKAKTKILEDRKTEFETTYNEFAPLGSSLKRFDRKINVIEQEYLQLLHSLNLSRMRKQNIELSTNLQVMDPPFFPLEPEPSKKKLLIAVGGIVGFILTLAILIAMEYLDNTIKSEDRAQHLIGLKLASAYPILKRKKINKRIDYKHICHRLVERLAHQVRKRVDEDNPSKPIIILFFSIKKGEGKTTIMTRTVNYLRQTGNKVLCIIPQFDGDIFNQKNEFLYYINHEDNITYQPQIDFPAYTDINQIPESQSKIHSNYHLIFLEVPSIMTSEIPLFLFKKSTYSLLVTRSNRTWTNADKAALEIINNITQHPPQILLNGMKLDFLEAIIGDIPKKRWWIRRTIKRWAKFEFKSRRKFS